jgi:hypothetical protein
MKMTCTQDCLNHTCNFYTIVNIFNSCILLAYIFWLSSFGLYHVFSRWLPTTASIFNIEMDAPGSSKTLVTVYQTAGYHNSGDHNQNQAVMLSAISSQVTPIVFCNSFFIDSYVKYWWKLMNKPFLKHELKQDGIPSVTSHYFHWNTEKKCFINILLYNENIRIYNLFSLKLPSGESIRHFKYVISCTTEDTILHLSIIHNENGLLT